MVMGFRSRDEESTAILEVLKTSLEMFYLGMKLYPDKVESKISFLLLDNFTKFKRIALSLRHCW